MTASHAGTLRTQALAVALQATVAKHIPLGVGSDEVIAAAAALLGAWLEIIHPAGRQVLIEDLGAEMLARPYRPAGAL